MFCVCGVGWGGGYSSLAAAQVSRSDSSWRVKFLPGPHKGRCSLGLRVSVAGGVAGGRHSANQPGLFTCLVVLYPCPASVCRCAPTSAMHVLSSTQLMDLCGRVWRSRHAQCSRDRLCKVDMLARVLWLCVPIIPIPAGAHQQALCRCWPVHSQRGC